MTVQDRAQSLQNEILARWSVLGSMPLHGGGCACCSAVPAMSRSDLLNDIREALVWRCRRDLGEAMAAALHSAKGTTLAMWLDEGLALFEPLDRLALLEVVAVMVESMSAAMGSTALPIILQPGRSAGSGGLQR
jgi:hypothetical protein